MDKESLDLLSFYPRRGRLPWSQRLSYGVGHVLNDLTASLWFSYLIVYLQFVLGFDTSLAGLVLMVGQVADAVATPLIGYEGDAAGGSHLCLKYGRRKCLHLIGTLAVIVSFPFIFSGCPGCPGHPSNTAMFVLLIPLVCVFQFGWAATQVAHLALIPDLTEDQDERDFLNIIRYAFDVIADVMVYVVAWVVFDYATTGEEDTRKIGFEDAGKFLIIVLIVTAIGSVFSFLFQFGVKERARPLPGQASSSWKGDDDQEEPVSSSTSGTATPVKAPPMIWSDWMKEPNFYQIAFIYTTTRLFHNFISVFIPLYLSESLGAHQDLIAKIPLVMNLSGFASSLFLKFTIGKFGKKVSYALGALTGLAGCCWIGLDSGYPFCAKGIYGVAVLLGTGSSAMVVCSLSFVPDLIGSNVESGGYVYGAMSFFDKMANGVGVLLVQYLHGVYCDVDCHTFYRKVLAYGTGGIAIISALFVLSVNSGTLAHRAKGANGRSPEAGRPAKRYVRNAEETTEFDKRILIQRGIVRASYDDSSSNSETKPLLG